MQNPNINPENNNTINTFDDIRKVLNNLPHDTETLSKLNQEITELVSKRGHSETVVDIQSLMSDIVSYNNDSAKLSSEQKDFLDQASDKLEDYIDSISEE